MDYDLKEILENIKDRKQISISYLQRTFSLGFPKSGRIFKDLIDKGYIDKDGRVNNEQVHETNEPNRTSLKIVFLDVDGVLNCSSTKDTCDGYVGIDDEKVKLLKKIVGMSNAKIVLTSTWKFYWHKELGLKNKQDSFANHLDKKLNEQGLSIMDKTEDEGLNRGDGILEYIRHLKWKGVDVYKFVILDDEMFDYKETKLTKNLIQTSYFNGGLGIKHVRRAIEKLS